MAILLERLYRNFLTDPGSLEEEIFNDLAIRKAELAEEGYRHPEKFAKWAILASIAETEYRAVKRAMEEFVWPTQANKITLKLEELGQRATKDRVDTAVRATKEYQDQANLISEHGAVLDIMKKAESAFWHRKDMLRTFGYKQREEEFAKPIEDSELKDWSKKALEKPKRQISLEEAEEIAEQKIRSSKNGC